MVFPQLEFSGPHPYLDLLPIRNPQECLIGHGDRDLFTNIVVLIRIRRNMSERVPFWVGLIFINFGDRSVTRFHVSASRW